MNKLRKGVAGQHIAEPAEDFVDARLRANRLKNQQKIHSLFAPAKGSA
jgi:hypothetical protein